MPRQAHVCSYNELLRFSQVLYSLLRAVSHAEGKWQMHN